MTAQARTGTDAPEAPRDLAEKSAAQAKEKLPPQENLWAIWFLG